MNLENELTDLISGVLGKPVVWNASQATTEVPGWNSLNHVRIMIAVEKKYSIRLAAADAVKVKTLGNLFELVEGKVRG